MKEETIPIVQPLQCIKLEHSNVLIECFPQVTMSGQLLYLSALIQFQMLQNVLIEECYITFSNSHFFILLNIKLHSDTRNRNESQVVGFLSFFIQTLCTVHPRGYLRMIRLIICLDCVQQYRRIFFILNLDLDVRVRLFRLGLLPESRELSASQLLVRFILSQHLIKEKKKSRKSEANQVLLFFFLPLFFLICT